MSKRMNGNLPLKQLYHHEIPLGVSSAGRYLGIAFILSCTFFNPIAYAKRVKIQWQEMKGAVQYEIQLQNEEKTILNEKVEDPLWKGDLQPGSYHYKIRAFDKVKRAGSWTNPVALAIMPNAPKILLPTDGKKFEHYNPHLKTKLSWESVVGAKGYTLELKRNGRVLFKKQLESESLELTGLESGKYTWKVAAILGLSMRSPAALRGKKWEAEKTSEADFKIEIKQLETPLLVEPIGVQNLPEDGKMKLTWKTVDGAEAYEVQLIKTKKPLGDSTLADDFSKARRYLTRDNSLVAKVNGEGDYAWNVRALANYSEKNVPQAIGNESQANFLVDKNTAFKSDLGYLAISSMVSPYNYSVNSPRNGIMTGNGGVSSISLLFRASGEYWFSSQWGASAGGDYSTFQIKNQTFSREAVELLAKYRTKLSAGMHGWSISPKLGFELRDYNELQPQNLGDPNNSQLTSSDIFTLGASVGFDVRRQFSDSFGLGLKVSYFIPFTLLSGAPSGSSISSQLSYRNVSVGLQGLYWITKNWGVGLGGFFELRSISFLAPGSTAPDQISMDAAYFFGSILYRFWK